MFEIGRVCLKIAGRDAGKLCTIIELIDDSFVMVDGETRRRKVNKKHLEPTKTVLKINKGASTEEVAKAFETIGVIVKKTNPKNAGPRPKKERKLKEKTTKKESSKKSEKPKKEKPEAKEKTSKENNKKDEKNDDEKKSTENKNKGEENNKKNDQSKQ